MASRPKLRRRRRTKIIATLGPASATMEVLTRLFQAGADVFRLNFSHGSHEDHAMRFAMICSRSRSSASIMARTTGSGRGVSAMSTQRGGSAHDRDHELAHVERRPCSRACPGGCHDYG